MKTRLLQSSFYVVGSAAILSAVLIVGLWSYSRATGDEITVCVKRNGLVYVIGDGFKSAECKKNETLVSWNIQGPPGPQGPQGPVGPVAPQGAGDIAFYFAIDQTLYILKNDGTVWRLETSIRDDVGIINRWALQANDWPEVNPPIPVDQIMKWSLRHLLASDGNVWVYGLNKWTSAGHP